MAWRVFFWTDEIIGHLAEHDVTPVEFEEVVSNPDEVECSRSTGEPAAIGDVGGRTLFCVYREIDDVCIEPVTAYEI